MLPITTATPKAPTDRRPLMSRRSRGLTCAEKNSATLEYSPPRRVRLMTVTGTESRAECASVGGEREFDPGSQA